MYQAKPTIAAFKAPFSFKATKTRQSIQLTKTKKNAKITVMKQYLDMLNHVLTLGETRQDRTGVGTLSVFGYQTRYDLREGFPLVTTKKIVFKSLVYELLWFLKGATNIYDGLKPHTGIWDPWADADGNLGPIYGHQWRSWPNLTQKDSGKWENQPIDQIHRLLENIKTDPSSRRLIVSAWNVSDLEKMALPPCHILFQFYVINGFLDCQLYQRSADLAIGVPFNIASYALLLSMIAQQCQLTPRYFVHTFGDLHLYQNHLEGVKDQLTRNPKPLPTLHLNHKNSIDDYCFEDITLLNYQHDDFIKFPIAV